MKKTAILLALTTSLGLTACAQPNMDNRVYSRDAAMRAQQVVYGTIIDVRTVELRGINGNSDRVVGAVAGGVLGALAGDQFGGGRGNTLATGAGAIGGAFLGDSLSRGINRTTAQEWTVRLANGGTIAVVQNDPNLFVGQNIRVINNGAQSRLVY